MIALLTDQLFNIRVSKGSILGALLFSINVVDILYCYEDNEIKNYSDYATPSSSATVIPTVNCEFLVTSTKLFN